MMLLLSLLLGTTKCQTEHQQMFSPIVPQPILSTNDTPFIPATQMTMNPSTLLGLHTTHCGWVSMHPCKISMIASYDSNWNNPV